MPVSLLRGERRDRPLRLTWRRGDYDTAALEGVYTADDARVRIVLRELMDKVQDLGAMRALGFCVSVKHAAFMAERFRAAGIPAWAVSGASSPQERAEALQALRDRQVNALFAVDLFNEGLDVPDVDTLLLLRPTQSATVFLQQLGRGLRRTPDKPVLTVLDFIGQQSREFRFDLKYRAVTGATRTGLQRQLERGFGFLPSGCELVLDPVARQLVLDNVRRQLRLSRKDIEREVRSHGDLDLAGWLRESGRELTDVFRYGSWTGLRRSAGLPTAVEGPADAALLKRVAAFAHCDDPERVQVYGRLVSGPVRYEQLSEREQRYARMLFFSLWLDGGRFATYQDGFDVLAGSPAVGEEIRAVVDLAAAGADHVSGPLEAGMQQVTLRTRARYSREEILAAIDYAHLKRTPKSHMTGVVYSEAAATDALMVTLHKAEGDYSPTTMYRDYALSPELFHWESQNSTAAASGAGQRYTDHRARGSHVVLLARQSRLAEWGGPLPYTCLGPATYVSHEGDRPMAITGGSSTRWRRTCTGRPR